MYSKRLLSRMTNFYKYSKYNGGAQVISKAPHEHFTKAPKIKDLLIWVNVVGPGGEPRRLPGFTTDHLSTILNRHFTEGFYSDCGGGDTVRRVSDDTLASSSKGVWCGWCQVEISDPWIGYMKPSISVVETEVLMRNSMSYTPKLACCIRLKPWMNEMVVTVPINPNVEGVDLVDNRFDDTVTGSGASKTSNI